MVIKIKGAREHNLKNINIDIEDGLTVVTGVSGSGKTSLIFDTLYKEAHRRFLEAFSVNKDEMKLNPAKVNSISGMGTTIALGQNLLNRNPNSTLASATGLIPLFKILFSRFGTRKCHKCGSLISVLKEEEIVSRIEDLKNDEKLQISAILMKKAKGSHRTLLALLEKEFGSEAVIIDSHPLVMDLDPNKAHDIQVIIGNIDNTTQIVEIRALVRMALMMGSRALEIKGDNTLLVISLIQSCVECGTWFDKLEPYYFNKNCPHCKGKGCNECNNSGYHPFVQGTTWKGFLFQDILKISVGELSFLFSKEFSANSRLLKEIENRVNMLKSVGLDYLTLDRITPTLSRGESQRVRLAMALRSNLYDVTHILDEPTIGQHPTDISRLMSMISNLPGRIIYIEHDRQAAIHADNAIDMGPGAGYKGGEVVFAGKIEDLWKANTPTGKYFSLREHVLCPKKRDPPVQFMTIKSAYKHNLKNIDVRIPINRLTVITGVSGSGKSTLIKEVLYNSLKNRKPSGCKSIEGPLLKAVLVNQEPIGKNPRSNPATYTKLSDIIRKLYAKESGLKSTYFSFNTPNGACDTCNGMGALEIKMRYLSSVWIECSDCEGKRFSEEVLSEKVKFGEKYYNISEFYDLPISTVLRLLNEETRVTEKELAPARQMLEAMTEIGLHYLSLGQPSPTLSGGEAQRLKLSKYLGKSTIKNQLMILDEPSTGLHPRDLSGLLSVLDKLLKAGATIVVVEHNSDFIRAADWVVDLGPRSGPVGGEVVYEGSYDGLSRVKHSLTASALGEEYFSKPHPSKKGKILPRKLEISIQKASMHNLKNISVNIPKNKFTVVTGVSGSGKSSLIVDTLEAEARRRYLETLSMYERQGSKETNESQVEEIIGLGVTALITPEKLVRGWIYNIRYTIGRVTDIILHLATIFSHEGKQKCPKCGEWMEKKQTYSCNKCDISLPIPKPRHFISSNYSAACLKCHGVGTMQVPNHSKLIISPEKPICGGAMHSLGFFPKGYLCKPYNMGYYIIQALADRYGFDQFQTPWKDLTNRAKNAFLHGDEEPLKVQFENKKGQKSEKIIKYMGFYKQWLRDWDVGGTYTDTIPCEKCLGTKLRPQYLEISFLNHNIHQMCELTLSNLYELLKNHAINDFKHDFVKNSYKIILRKLEFLNRTGLGYINLNRVAESLSAGEAQRVKLASLLGSELSALTIIVDEPTRGLHPTELQALIKALLDIRDKGNTIIAIEHDFSFIKSADHIIEMGPGGGAKGGYIVAIGAPSEISKKKTATSDWLSGKKSFNINKTRRKPERWLKIYGARANNLKGDLVEIPLGLITGVCGISGSGKSTLLIDTLARALVPITHTTSVSREPTKPGVHEKIEGSLANTIVVDQNKAKLGNPIKFLDLERYILKIFANTEDAKLLGLGIKELAQKCSSCKGRGYLKTDLSFLPAMIEECETCKGSGYLAEISQIRYEGYSLPEVNNFTFNEAYILFQGHDNITSRLKIVLDVQLGYLKLNQPGRTLSGGEAQRLKIVRELAKNSNKKTLYILDEPTIGQHLDEVSSLTKILQNLVNKGHTVIVIEHHPHLLACCDWLIELGPGAGPNGGHIIAKGTPETIAQGPTPTAKYIREVLEEKK
ncbi:MAG: ATP-binding cassette domain-containing protein [Candidatus Lokiarchaeota archaeon]|nr:ATP-binding cassette domain-containing protein [Candidatus Lokiarchaeota archaeon]